VAASSDFRFLGVRREACSDLKDGASAAACRKLKGDMFKIAAA